MNMNVKALAEIINRPYLKDAASKAVDDYLEFVKVRMQELVVTEPNALNEYGAVGVRITFISKEAKTIEHDDKLETCCESTDFSSWGHYLGDGIWIDRYSRISDPRADIVFNSGECSDDDEFYDLVINELTRRGFDVIVNTDEVEHDYREEYSIKRDIIPQILLHKSYSDGDVTTNGDKITARSLVEILEEPQRIAKMEEIARVAIEKYVSACAEKFEEFIDDSKLLTAMGLSIKAISFENAELVTGELHSYALGERVDDNVYSKDPHVLKLCVDRDHDRDSDLFMEVVLKKLEDEGFELTAGINKNELIPWLYANADES